MIKAIPLLLLVILISCKKEINTPDELANQFWCGGKEYVAGDSMSEGPGAVSWPLQFGQIFNGDQIQVGIYEGRNQLYLRDTSVINGGVSGEKSFEIADRVLKDPRRIGRNMIIWAGRNNPYFQDQVIADIDRLIEGNPKYRVLEILNGTWTSEGIGTDYYNNLAELNARLAAKHGIHFVWLKQYLQAAALPSDSIYIARDQVPQSLIIDSLHLNTNGYRLVAEAVAKSLVACQSETLN